MPIVYMNQSIDQAIHQSTKQSINYCIVITHNHIQVINAKKNQHNPTGYLGLGDEMINIKFKL